MPREIDRSARLKDIADSTIRVAHAGGSSAVTLRAVARELGGSTTLVTNYLPTRAALILNVLDHAQARWRSHYEQAAPALDALQRFELLISWDADPDDIEPVLRGLILEIVANASAEPTLRGALKHESSGYRRALLDAAADAGFLDPQLASDLGYFLLRGASFANAEDPEHWNHTRTRELVRAALLALPRRS